MCTLKDRRAAGILAWPVGLPAAALIGVAYVISNPKWDSITTATSTYSLLAFLSIAIAACLANLLRAEPSSANRVLLATLSYSAIIFGGAAVFYVVSGAEPVAHAGPGGIFLNLVAFSTTGLSSLTYSLMLRRPRLGESMFERRGAVGLLIAVEVALFVVCMYLSRQPLGELFIVAGRMVGGVSIVSYVIAALLTLTARDQDTVIDRVRLTIAFVLLASASSIHFSILPSPSAFWLLSMGLMMVAFMFATMATGFPFLMSTGVEARSAYAVVAALIAVAVVPVLMASVVSRVLDVSQVPDLGATIVIHLGGAVLAGATAYAMYNRSIHMPMPFHIPLVLLLSSWSVLEIALVFTRFLPHYGVVEESMVPYVVGGLISVMMLYTTNLRLLKMAPSRSMVLEGRAVGVGILIVVGVIIASEYAWWEVVARVPGLYQTSIGEAMMLSLGLLSLFVLLNFVMLLVLMSKGRITVDYVGALSSTVWIAIIIMKANFTDYTPGWWSAEILLLAATILFPLILLATYLRERRESDQLRDRLGLYLRLVGEEIADEHRSSIEKLDWLSRRPNMTNGDLSAISEALSSVTRADDLFTIMSSFLTEAPLSEEKLETLDVAKCLTTAIEMIQPNLQFELPSVVMKCPPGGCLVNANAMLSHAFSRLVIGVVNRLGSPDRMEVEISGTEMNGKQAWMTSVTFQIRTSHLELKRELVRRYSVEGMRVAPEFALAQRLIEMIHGDLQLDADVQEDSLIVTVRVILLAATVT
ncbi:MAG: hypothetical protein QXS20_01165 [Candidatus Thorarchaeota archaeon]